MSPLRGCLPIDGGYGQTAADAQDGEPGQGSDAQPPERSGGVSLAAMELNAELMLVASRLILDVQAKAIRVACRMS